MYFHLPPAARENMARIEHIPSDILPDDSPARRALMLLAAAGYDCYAYQSGGPIGIWCVWLGELAYGIQDRDDRNGRVPIAKWVAQWHDLLAVAVKARQRKERGDQYRGDIGANPPSRSEEGGDLVGRAFARTGTAGPDALRRHEEGGREGGDA